MATATPTRINFQAYLAGDPTLHAQVQAINDAGIARQAQLTAARRAAMVRYGLVPTDAGSDIDQVTRDLAAQATRSGFSAIGQLRHDYGNAQSLVRGSLGERGIIRSSAYGQHTNENLRALQLGEAGAADTLQQNLGGAQNDYLAAQDALRQQLMGATGDASQRIIDQINAGLIGGNPGGAGATGGAAAGPTGGPSIGGFLARHPSDAGGRSATSVTHAAPRPPVVPQLTRYRGTTTSPRML